MKVAATAIHGTFIFANIVYVIHCMWSFRSFKPNLIATSIKSQHRQSYLLIILKQHSQIARKMQFAKWRVPWMLDPMAKVMLGYGCKNRKKLKRFDERGFDFDVKSKSLSKTKQRKENLGRQQKIFPRMHFGGVKSTDLIGPKLLWSEHFCCLYCRDVFESQW